MKKRLIAFWPLGLLLIATFILRTIKLGDLFYFTYDESVFAFVGRRMALWQHIPLIGGATPFGFHVAPYFYWFFSLTLIIGKLNPLFWGYVASAIAVSTTFMIWRVGASFDSKKVGITAAALWTFSFLANVYDRHFWGLNFGSAASLLVIYSLYKIVSSSVVLNPSLSRVKNLKTIDKFTSILGLSLALIIHADLSFYVFLLLAVVVWLVFKLPIRKSTIVAVFIIMLSFIPLVIFDLRHNFANTRPVVDFIKRGQIKPDFDTKKFTGNFLIFPQALTRLTYTFGDNEVSKQYSYCRIYVAEKLQKVPWYLITLSSISLITFVFWSFKRNANTGWKLTALLAVLYFVGIQLYGTILQADIFEHYLSGLFAVFLLILAKVISLLPKKLWLFAMAIFIIANLYKLSVAQNDMGLAIKRQAIEYTMQEVGEKDFSLDSLSTCWKLNGYRYLFAVFGREPVKSYVDPNFAYLYGTTPVAGKHPATVVAFVVHDFAPETEEFYKRYTLLKSHEIKSALFGNIEVIVMDNSTGWFDKS